MSNETASDFSSPADFASADVESLGAWLARVRAGHNVEQREVARHLGLNPIIIRAIESDDFARLGPPVFVRGYLSRYARFLNLPEQAVLERYQRQSGPTQEPPPLKVMHPLRRQTRIRDLRGALYLLVVVGIAWTAIQNLNIGDFDPGSLLARWSSDDPSGSKPAAPAKTAVSQTHYPFQAAPDDATATIATPATPPLAGETQAAPPAEAGRPAAGPTSPPSPASTPAAPISSAEPATVAATSPGVVTATVAATPGLVTATVAATPGAGPTEEGVGHSAGAARLLLEFSNDCWVEVKDAQGNVLANGLMKANTARTISGSAPFKVTLGNAPAARIILDDRLVNTEIYVPRRGTVSRFTLDRGQP